jgi:hypothetical protein
VDQLFRLLSTAHELVGANATTTAIAANGGRPEPTKVNRPVDTRGSHSKQGGQRRKASTAGTSQGNQPREQSGNGRGPSKDNTAAARTQRDRSERGNDSRTGQSGTSQRSQRRGGHTVFWTRAKSERPEFVYDETETGKVLNSLERTLFIDSQGAAMAFAHFVTMHRDHRYTSQALSTLGGFLTQLHPTPASLALAEQALREMSQTSEPRDALSANLFLTGQRYQQLYSHPSGDEERRDIVNELLTNADAFDRLESNRRQACGLIMAADILHTQGEFDRARTLWVRALTLISVAYKAQMIKAQMADFSEAAFFGEAMLNLARSADPQIVEETIIHSDQMVHNGGHHIAQAPAGTFAG